MLKSSIGASSVHPCCRHHPLYTIQHTPHTIHHTAYTMHNAPYTIHHAPCTIHYRVHSPRQRFETSSLIASVLLARPSVSEELRDDVAASLKTKGFVANAKTNASASGAGAMTRGTGTIRVLLDHAREALRCAQAHHTSKTGMHPRVALAHRRVGDGLMLAAGEMLQARHLCSQAV